MSPDSVVFRAAKPTLDEGFIFARYLDQAAEGFFRFMIGRRAEHVIATAFLQPHHDLSHQNATFAEQEGAIIGMVSGYTAKQHRGASRRPLKEAAGKSNFRIGVVSVLFAPFMRIIDSVNDGDFYVQAIAVNKEQRGGGVGSALMDFIEKKAIANGSSRLVVVPAISNTYSGKHRTVNGSSFVLQVQSKKVFEVIPF